jgi:hypothetical protein
MELNGKTEIEILGKKYQISDWETRQNHSFIVARKRLFCQTRVMLSLRFFSGKLQLEQGFLFFFVGGKNIFVK